MTALVDVGGLVGIQPDPHGVDDLGRGEDLEQVGWGESEELAVVDGVLQLQRPRGQVAPVHVLLPIRPLAHGAGLDPAGSGLALSRCCLLRP